MACRFSDLNLDPFYKDDLFGASFLNQDPLIPSIQHCWHPIILILGLEMMRSSKAKLHFHSTFP